MRFENAFSPAPLTLPAHWTLHTGLEPWHHGVADNGLAADLPPGLTLAEKLGAAGYDTAAFISAFVLHSTFGLDRGFARYDDGPAADAALDQVVHPTAPADERVGRALRWLQRRQTGAAPKRPFFLWLHLFDPHAPYAPPAEFRARYRERPYDGEIAFTDQQVGRLLAGLDRLGLAENTLVALTADHGESLGEHGEATHGVLLYDATLRVPLVLRLPARLPAGELRRDLASLADVAPTLLALAGLPASGTDGRDLFGQRRISSGSLGAISEGPRRRFGWAPLSAIREGQWKYLAGPRPELYDWQADPGELRDLSGQEWEKADRLARGARSIEKELEARLAERAGTTAENAEVRAGLAALGYVGDSGGRPRRAAPTKTASLPDAGATPPDKSSLPCVGAALRGRPPSGPADPREAIAAMSELDRAYQLFAENRFELAEKEFRALLECADFPAAPALEGLARIARLRGDRPAAEAAYARLLAADPESSRRSPRWCCWPGSAATRRPRWRRPAAWRRWRRPTAAPAGCWPRLWPRPAKARPPKPNFAAVSPPPRAPAGCGSPLPASWPPPAARRKRAPSWRGCLPPKSCPRTCARPPRSWPPGPC